MQAELGGEVGAGVAGAGEELAAAADAETLVQGLHVIVDRVPAQIELEGDLLLTAPRQQLIQSLLKTRREIAGWVAGTLEGITPPQAAKLQVEQPHQTMLL